MTPTDVGNTLVHPNGAGKSKKFCPRVISKGLVFVYFAGQKRTLAETRGRRFITVVTGKVGRIN